MTTVTATIIFLVQSYFITDFQELPLIYTAYICCLTSCVCIQRLIHRSHQVAKCYPGNLRDQVVQQCHKGLQTDKTQVVQEHIQFYKDSKGNHKQKL